jgi:hypothetical protein
MSLSITGKLVKKLETENITSKAGKEYVKQSFVIDTGDQYNPNVAFGLFGQEKVDMLISHKEGDEIEVLFNLSSREHKGRYYTQADAWSVKGDALGNEPSVTPEEDEDLPDFLKD